MSTEPRHPTGSGTDAFLERLSTFGTPLDLALGTTLFHQGDPADALYVLVSGRLDISTLSAEGRKLSHILLKPGAIFGELALFDGGARSATVTAKVASRVLRITRSRVMEDIRQDPDTALELLRLAIGRMRWMSKQLSDLAFAPLEVRLARKLDHLFKTFGEGDTLRISQGELAEHINVTREAVSRALAEMKAQGIVDLGRGKIELREAAALHALCARDD